jgi:hypothetical protein
MAEAGFDTHELSELSREFLRTAEKLYPQRAKKFLADQANKGKKVMRSEIRSRVKGHRKRTTKEEKKTSLSRGVDKGRAHKYQEDWQVRVYNKAKHAYLVEHGHSNVKTRGGRSAIPVGMPIVMVPGRKTAGPLFIGRDGAVRRIEGRYFAAATTKRMKEAFPEDAENFLDELMKEGLEL